MFNRLTAPIFTIPEPRRPIWRILKKKLVSDFFGELFAKFVKKLASVSLKKVKNSNTSNFSPFHPRNEILAQECHLLIQQQEKVTNNTIWQLEGCFIIQFRILSTMFRFADRLFIKTNVYHNLQVFMFLASCLNIMFFI